jgi:O-6-methylguanine DNA methyltransferase
MKHLDAFSTKLSRWEALVQRNSEADNFFMCGVLTTGIYCRPSCPSRLPNRKNVRFFNTWQQAEQAGFRPCKRCTPQLSNKPETSTASLGMKSLIYRHGGRGVSIRYAIVQSYLGWVLVAVTEKGICKIDFGNTPEILQAKLKADFPQAEVQDNDPNFDAIVAKVLAFLEAPDQGLELPLDIQGTAFQRRVWLALQDIPSGSTASYTEIAARIGSPKAARAVAQACASNHLAVTVPCHRVVRSNGDLGGYRWGIDRKRAILDREANAKNLMTLRR